MMDDNNSDLNGLDISGETTESLIISNISSAYSNESSTIQSAYCDQSFKAFGDGYRSIHGYTSLVVCVLGTVANILNLVVLTRKKMINPTNAILTGLALADLLNMVEYIPFVMYMYFLPDSNGAQRKTYGWAIYVLVHSNFSQVCHTISIWLTVTLAVWRYIMVAMPIKSKVLCSMDRAKWSIFIAYFASPILCVSNYLTFSIRAIQPKPLESNLTETETSTPLPTTNNVKYIVHLSDLAKNHPFIMTANFWLYSVVIKIIPCILLTVVSYRLINSLIEAKKRKNKLLATKIGANNGERAGNVASSAPGTTGRGLIRGLFNTGANEDASSSSQSSGADRTTKMLTAVLLLFLITEFPQGLLALLSGVLGDAFFKSCYIPLADLMDFLALLNSAINFILYCSMSKNFRDTFSEIFHINRVAELIRKNSESSNPARSRSPPSNQFRLSSASRHLLGRH